MKKSIDKAKRHLPLDLRGRQSVRTTFRISPKANEQLVWLADEYDVTLKDVLDDALLSHEFIDEWTHLIAKGDLLSKEEPSVRKTHVVSRRTVDRLRDLANKHGITRDEVLESLVYLIAGFAKDRIQETRKLHKKALDIMSQFEAAVDQTMERLGNVLDGDDPIILRFDCIRELSYELISAIQSEQKDGTPIDVM